MSVRYGILSTSLLVICSSNSYRYLVAKAKDKGYRYALEAYTIMSYYSKFPVTSASLGSLPNCGAFA